MKIQVVTSWNNKLFKEYAHRFQSTYNWPFDLIVYNEDDDMFDKIPDLKKFIERNQHRKVKSFKDDGVRFSYKVYAYTHAIDNCSKDIDGLICNSQKSLDLMVEFTKLKAPNSRYLIVSEQLLLKNLLDIHKVNFFH